MDWVGVGESGCWLEAYFFGAGGVAVDLASVGFVGAEEG